MVVAIRSDLMLFFIGLNGFSFMPNRGIPRNLVRLSNNSLVSPGIQTCDASKDVPRLFKRANAVPPSGVLREQSAESHLKQSQIAGCLARPPHGAIPAFRTEHEVPLTSRVPGYQVC